MFLVTHIAAILVPDIARQIPKVSMLTSLLGEGAVAIWRALFGVKSPAGLAADQPG